MGRGIVAGHGLDGGTDADVIDDVEATGIQGADAGDEAACGTAGDLDEQRMDGSVAAVAGEFGKAVALLPQGDNKIATLPGKDGKKLLAEGQGLVDDYAQECPGGEASGIGDGIPVVLREVLKHLGDGNDVDGCFEETEDGCK